MKSDITIDELMHQNERLKSSYDSMYSSMLDANQEIMRDLKESQRNNAPLTVSERVMEAVQLIVECGINRNTWVLYTGDDARDAMRSKQLIDESTSEIERLEFLLAERRVEVGRNEKFIRKDRQTISDLRDKFNDRARKAELYKEEINRLRKILGTADREINELSSQYCDLGDKLEKIGELVCGRRDLTYSGSNATIDEIRKIIKEK